MAGLSAATPECEIKTSSTKVDKERLPVDGWCRTRTVLLVVQYLPIDMKFSSYVNMPMRLIANATTSINYYGGGT